MAGVEVGMRWARVVLGLSTWRAGRKAEIKVGASQRILGFSNRGAPVG